MKTLSLLLTSACIINCAAAQTVRDSLLFFKVDKLFCFRTADKELDKLAQLYRLKLNYKKERMQQYSLALDFHNDNLQFILNSICKSTRSQYFISQDNTIYIVGKFESFTPEATKAIQQQEARELVRPMEETPKKFNVTVAGKITDVVNGESIPNASISVKGANNGTSTNVDGFFTLYNVPSDTAILEISNVGYQVSRIFLSPQQALDSVSIQLVPVKNALSEVVVTAKKNQSFKLNQKVSMIKLTPSLISTLPSIGEKDIFRSFQLMPGISAANENSSGLYVRGGTPDQSLTLFDGFTVYNVEHLFGFFSAFNSNAIKEVSLYKGGFEAKYGGRLSSVVDIIGKEGNKKAFNFGGDVSLMSVNLFGEGPIAKNITGIIHFRRSFQTALYDKIFNRYSGESSSSSSGNNPFGSSGQSTKSFFYDLNAKFTWKPTKKDVFSLSTYNGKDDLDNSTVPNVPSGLQGSGTSFGIKITDVTKWGNNGASFKWSRRWNKQWFSNTLVSYSNYFSNRDRSANISSTDESGKETNVKRGTLEDNNLIDYSLKTDVEFKLNKKQTIEFGYHFTNNDIKYTYAQNDTSTLIDRATTGNTLAFYGQNKISLLKGNLQITPGIRAVYFQPTSKMYYEPRLMATYDLSSRIKLKGSYGKYYQFAKRVIREDILQGSRDFWVLADNDKLPVSASTQFVLGASWETNDWLVDVEAYHKQLEGLSEYSLRFTPSGRDLNYSENFYEGTGYARGIDLLIQKKFGKYTGWVGYTLGEAKNQYDVYGAAEFYASNDVRHEFKTVHTYKWRNWDLAATFILATGKPYTAPSGGYTVTLLDGTTQDFINVSDKNTYRLPLYHRLDLAVTYNFGQIGTGNGTVGLSLFNIYNRENIWYKSYELSGNSIIATDVKYLGFTPNIIFTYRFK